MIKYSLIYSVFATSEQAKKVARVLVEEKLIACANILPAHSAIYEWEGKIVEESEVIMLAKTISENFMAVEKRICGLHSYETPCVLEVALENIAPEFAKWVRNAVIEK